MKKKTLKLGPLGNVNSGIMNEGILKETTLLTGTPPPMLGQHNREGGLNFKILKSSDLSGQADFLYASVLTINHQ